jgi:chromate transport protein ChrA
MNSISSPSSRFAAITGKRVLSLAATSWCSVAFFGQWLFTAYIIGLYGVSAVQGDFERWSAAMPHGYTAGDWAGNLSIALHLLVAALINVGGPLQLIPYVRTRWPKFHRWTGRAYVLAGYLVSLTGLYLVWVRGSVGGPVGAISLSLNAVLIILFATMAIRLAKARNFPQHRKWALRLFMVMSGVWFFRVGLMLWLLIHQAPVGFDPETFRGPFLTFLNFAQYLLPLLLLELYFRAQEKFPRLGQYLIAALIGLATIGTALGVFAVSVGMWWA